MYGKELILDLHDCDLPTSRQILEKFFKELCELIDMEREDLHFWDYEGDREGYEKADDHLKGISAIQFIKTSNITIHTIDVQRKVFLNIFSCKDFDAMKAQMWAASFFKGEIAKSNMVERL